MRLPPTLDGRYYCAGTGTWFAERRWALDPADRVILDLFADRVRAVEPRARVWAFGSRARGSPHPESDFDLCVVVPERGEAVERAIRDVAWEIGFAHERVLTTVVLSRYDFEAGPMSASTLVANIRRDGQTA